MAKIITFSGVDGSGKSSVSSKLFDRLNQTHSVKRVHTGNIYHMGGNSKSKSHRNWYAFLPVYLTVLFKDYLQIITTVVKHKRSAEFLIFDRYMYDSIAKVQQKASRKFPWVDRLFLFLTPTPHYAIYLHGDPQVSYIRDNDFPVEYHETKRTLYNQLFQNLVRNYYPINFENSLSEIADAVHMHIAKPSILLINYYYPPLGRGGAQYTKTVAEYFSQHRYNIHILGCMTSETQQTYSGNPTINTHRLPIQTSNPLIFNSILFVYLLLQNIKTTYLIGNHISHCAALLYRKRYEYFVSVVHNTYLQRYEAKKQTLVFRLMYPPLIKVERFLLNRSDHIITISHRTKKYLDQINIHQAVSVIENGVDTQRFMSVSKPTDTFNFLYVGKLSKDKRVFETLTLFHTLLQNHDVAQNSNLHIVGGGPVEQELQQYLEKHPQLKHHVTMHGYLPDVKPIYAQCHCLLLLSASEGLPLVLLEAAASSLSIVCNQASSGDSSIVVNNVNGFIVSNDLNEQEIVTAMKHCLTHPEMNTESQHIANTFDWNIQLEKYKMLLQQLSHESQS